MSHNTICLHKIGDAIVIEIYMMLFEVIFTFEILVLSGDNTLQIIITRITAPAVIPLSESWYHDVLIPQDTDMCSTAGAVEQEHV